MESNILLAVYVIAIFMDYNVISCNVESINDRGSGKIFTKKNKTPVIIVICLCLREVLIRIDIYYQRSTAEVRKR